MRKRCSYVHVFESRHVAPTGSGTTSRRSCRSCIGCATRSQLLLLAQSLISLMKLMKFNNLPMSQSTVTYFFFFRGKIIPHTFEFQGCWQVVFEVIESKEISGERVREPVNRW